MSKTNDKQAPRQKTTSQAYAKPTLTRFGKVRELTAGGTGLMDEGMGMMGSTDPNRRP
jgi:hypothetical protein